MSKLEQAARRALEAIGDCSPNKALVKAAYALREALAEQGDQRPQNCGTGYCSCIECPYDECVQDKGQCNNGCLMNKTTKALKLAEEAFEALVHTPIAGHIWTGKCNPALFAIREALAEQAEQEPLMDYERINALREGEQNGAEDAYFFVRPENDTPSLRKMFCQGFERGFHKGLKYATPVQQVDLTDDEIAEITKDFGSSEYRINRIMCARAVIAAHKEKNK